MENSYTEIWPTFPQNSSDMDADKMLPVARARMQAAISEMQKTCDTIWANHQDEIFRLADNYIKAFRSAKHYSILPPRPDKTYSRRIMKAPYPIYLDEYTKEDFSNEPWELAPLAELQREVILEMIAAVADSRTLINNIYKEGKQKLYINYTEELSELYDKMPCCSDIVEYRILGYIAKH